MNLKNTWCSQMIGKRGFWVVLGGSRGVPLELLPHLIKVLGKIHPAAPFLISVLLWEVSVSGKALGERISLLLTPGHFSGILNDDDDQLHTSQNMCSRSYHNLRCRACLNWLSGEAGRLMALSWQENGYS